MADFSIQVSDSTRVSNSLLWSGIVRASDQGEAHVAIDKHVVPGVIRETGLNPGLLRISSTEIVPHLTPDVVA